MDLDEDVSALERLTIASRSWRTNGRIGATSFPVYTPTNEAVPWIGYDGNQVAVGGFDAATDGSTLTVACHLERTDRFFYMLIEPGRNIAFIGVGIGPPPPTYTPPPADATLAHGLGRPNIVDRHKLRVITLD